MQVFKIKCYTMLNGLKRESQHFVHNFQNIMILRELEKFFGEIYLGGKKTISTDMFFILENIATHCQMDASEFEGMLYTMLSQVPWLARTATFIPPLNAGSMALESTTFRLRHGVGEGGERGPERKGERTGGAGDTGNGQGTETGESGGGKEANGRRKEKGDRWWGAFKRTRGSTKEEVPIIFGTYNIRNGSNGGLESALRGMSQASMDLGIFQETKCTDGIYTRKSAGYRVVATDAPIRQRGGVALFYRPSPLFEVEAVQEYRPNFLSFEVTTRAWGWYIIGCYLAPDDAETIERLVTALGDKPRGTALIVAGDLNTNLGDTENNRRGSEIAAEMTEAGG